MFGGSDTSDSTPDSGRLPITTISLISEDPFLSDCFFFQYSALVHHLVNFPLVHVTPRDPSWLVFMLLDLA